MKRLAYPTLPRLPNPARSLQRTVRGLAAPCTPAGAGPTGPSQQLPETKRPPKMDSLANPKFAERQLSQPKQPKL